MGFAVNDLALWLPTSALSGGIGGIILPVALLVGMHFVMVLPNQRKQKQWKAMLDGLKTGDKVTTNGGIRGTILQVKDDSIIVRVAPDGLKLEFVKSAIAGVTTDEAK